MWLRPPFEDWRRALLAAKIVPMTFNEQFAEFALFAQSVAEGRDDVTIDEVIDCWWDDRHRDADLAAIKASAEDYDRGERGIDARVELAEHRHERRPKA